jgi:hypothetical protein
MKRVVLTAFLVVFAASIIGRSVARTVAYTAQHADDLGHSKSDRGAARMGEARKHTSWQVHTKVLQDSFATDSLERSVEPPQPDRTLQHIALTFASDQYNHTLSSRAPPTLI